MSDIDMFNDESDAALEKRLDAPRRAEASSPDRCTYTSGAKFQCNNLKVPGTQFCFDHNKETRQRRKFRYKLLSHGARVEELFHQEDRKSLDSEIAIIQSGVESIYNRCSNENDLLINLPRLEALVEKIGRLQVMNTKIETITGQFVDKVGLDRFVDEIIKILSEEVNDVILLAKISERIGGAIESTINASATKAQERLSS